MTLWKLVVVGPAPTPAAELVFVASPHPPPRTGGVFSDPESTTAIVREVHNFSDDDTKRAARPARTL